MRGLLVAGVSLSALAGVAHAADPTALPVKAPPPPVAYDWSGFYLGGHFGYAAGSSNWSAAQTGVAAPAVSGSLDLFNSYDMFRDTGSEFAGFQGGYNYILPSRWLFGIEADVSFPSFADTPPHLISGISTLSSPSIGVASYSEQVEFSGTVRGRIGYAPGNWLFYATGGFAWTYDQFTRTQVAGMPAGGTAIPGTVENAFMVPRAGWTIGSGAEVALSPKWTARVEYLFTDYGTRSVLFPLGAQKFDSDLTLSEFRVGLNYRLGGDSAKFVNAAAAFPALETDNFAVHGQTTFLEQYDPPFRAPYAGPNSLTPNEGRETWDVTAYLGWRLWSGAELWVDPEIDQGFGLSDTLGVAGFTSGEAYKVGQSTPYLRLQRAFIRQTINLGGDSEKVESAANQFSGSQTANRLVITVGKFAVIDVFDTNKYAHDPRNDFMNWALVDTGTFDYAADSWGYTYGTAVEWYQGPWTVRAGVFDLSIVPNSTELDPTFQQFQMVGEIERRYDLWGHPGKLAVTGFLTRGRMGSFADAIALAQATGGPADIAAVRRYNSRGGVSANLEQEITSDLGVFVRAGWANGDVEPYEFSDIDRTVAAGFSMKGTRWGRPDDTWGFAGVVNGISGEHAAFLNDGGLGILVGDGQLPHPGNEQIIETYYNYAVSASTRVSVDYQFIANPAYNTDRGPVNVFSGRFHWQF